MPICEPYITAECDKCGEPTEDMEMTRLANGGWDARNIKLWLRRDGWLVDGDTTTCPECANVADLDGDK